MIFQEEINLGTKMNYTNFQFRAINLVYIILCLSSKAKPTNYLRTMYVRTYVSIALFPSMELAKRLDCAQSSSSIMLESYAYISTDYAVISIHLSWLHEWNQIS